MGATRRGLRGTPAGARNGRREVVIKCLHMPWATAQRK
jgi:hypothetical protein